MTNDTTFSQIIALLHDLTSAEIHVHPAHIGATLAGIKSIYDNSDIVIFRCRGYQFYVTDADNFTPCPMCERLLSNGEWQSQQRRGMENQLAYERVTR